MIIINYGHEDLISSNDKLNFARYSDENYDFKELNSIKIPLFMRWGTDNEYIQQKPNELVEFLKNKINNDNLDIDYIEEADHSYRGKENLLADQIIKFLVKRRNHQIIDGFLCINYAFKNTKILIKIIKFLENV